MRFHARVELTEIVPLPAEGRVFEMELRAGLADAAPGGRVRLDAIARWLQDVAYADIDDAGVAPLALWVVRRLRIQVAHFPRFGEHVLLRTWASGSGRLWAERRTTVTGIGQGGTALDLGAAGAAIEAVGLWVTIDPASGRPMRLPEEIERVYIPTTQGRQVKARLRHPRPDDGPERSSWRFRFSDMDAADHVNNAAYWTPFEERLRAGPEPASLDAEIEFRDPAQAGDVVVLGDVSRMWIASADGVVHASIVTG